MKKKFAAGIWMFLILALIPMGCNTTLDELGVSGLFQTAGSRPQSKFNFAQPAVLDSRQPAFQTRHFKRNTNQFFEQPQFVQTLGATLQPAGYPQKNVTIYVDEPVQFDTVHLSLYDLSAIEIFMNGQPVGAGDNAFPNSLVTVAVCSNGWVGNVQLCPKESLAQTNKVEPNPNYKIRQETVTLIVTAHKPGAYKLSLVTTHKKNNQTSTITQQINVVN